MAAGDADERADSPFYEVCPFLGGAVYAGAAEIRRRLNTIRTLAETLALAESFPSRSFSVAAQERIDYLM